MKQYRIIESSNPRQLENLLEQHIDSGWIPLGGVGFSPGGVGYFEKWYQSLTK